MVITSLAEGEIFEDICEDLIEFNSGGGGGGGNFPTALFTGGGGGGGGT